MEGILILVSMIVLAWVFILPGVLLGMVISLRRRTRELEYYIFKAGANVESYMAPSDTSFADEPVSDEASGIEQEFEEAYSPPPPPLPKIRPETPQTESAFHDDAETTAEQPDYGPPPPSPVVVFLQSVGMWPPKQEGADREVLLLQWWLPRIGGLLAVLAALFFGAYVNQQANPLVRWLELAGTAFGISALGLFFERRRQAFGSVLFVTGLVVCYLASVAAYALEPVKIVHSPSIGAVFQAAALALIVGAGLARRSPQIVNLAYAFSFFMLAFMAWTGLRDATYISAFLLLAAAPVLVHRYACRDLMWIAIPLGAVALLAFPFIQEWRTPLLPSALGTLLYLQGVIAIACALKIFFDLVNRRMLALALSLALLAVFSVGRLYSVPVLELLVGVSGLHLILWSAVARWRHRAVAFELAFIKGSFLLAVWVILHWHGDLRWMVLSLQAVLIALTYRSRPSIWLELATVAAIAASAWFYNIAMQSLPSGGSFLWWVMVVYPLVIILAASITAGVKSHQWDEGTYPFRGLIYVALAVCAVYAWCFLAVESVIPFSASDLLALAPYACAAIAFIPKLGDRRLPLGVAALSFAAANVFFWDQPFSVAALAILAVAATAIAFRISRLELSRSVVLFEGVAWILAIPSLGAWLDQALQGWDAKLALAHLITTGLIVAGALAQFRMLALATVILPFMLVEEGMPILSLATGFLWIGAGLYLRPLRDQKTWSFLFTIALWYGFAFQRLDAAHELPWLGWQAVAAVAAAVLFFFAKLRRLWGLWLGGVAFLGLLLVLHHQALILGNNWSSDILLSAAFIVCPLIVVNLWLGRIAVNSRVQALIDVTAAVLVFEVLFYTAQYNALHIKHLLTPISAAVCFGIIILGIAQKNRAWRLTGLILLLIPLCRLFLVDVQDAFYRIIAFGVAALFFVALGYIYHRIERRFSKDLA